MSRRYFNNPYTQRRDELAAAGVDTTPLTKENPVYKASSGKLYHFDSDCGRIRDKYSANEFSLNICELEPAVLCTTCCRSFDDDFVRTFSTYASRVLQTKEAVKEISVEAKKHPDWSHVVRVERSLAPLKDIFDFSAAETLWSDARDLIDEAHAVIRDISRRAGGHDSAIWRAASAVLKDDIPKHLDLTVFGKMDSWSGGSRLVAEFRSIFGNSDSLEEARDGFFKRVLAMGETPADFSQVPNKFQLNATDFLSLSEYAAAEWRLARDQAAEALFDYWSSKVTAEIERTNVLPDTVFLALNYTHTTVVDMLTPMLNPFGLRRFGPDNSHALVKVPAVVAAWVSGRTFDYRANFLLTSVEALPGDDDAVLSTAAGMYDAGNDRLNNLESLIQVARMVCGTK